MGISVSFSHMVGLTYYSVSIKILNSNGILAFIRKPSRREGLNGLPQQSFDKIQYSQ